MVEYELIKGKNALLKFKSHPIGKIESFILPENAVNIEKHKAYGKVMSGGLVASSLDGLCQQNILPFSVKIQGSFKQYVDRFNMEQLMKDLTINDAPMLKKQPIAPPEKVILNISNIKISFPYQPIKYGNKFYSLKNFKFKCNFEEKSWKD